MTKLKKCVTWSEIGPISWFQTLSESDITCFCRPGWKQRASTAGETCKTIQPFQHDLCFWLAQQRESSIESQRTIRSKSINQWLTIISSVPTFFVINLFNHYLWNYSEIQHILNPLPTCFTTYRNYLLWIICVWCGFMIQVVFNIKQLKTEKWHFRCNFLGYTWGNAQSN